MLLYLAALVVVALAAPQPQEQYTNKYDNVDLDQILNNERLLSGYFKCLLDKGPCTPDGAELKKNIPDALTNGCGKCTKHQQEGSEKIIKFLIDKKPDMWKELEGKYDPEGIYAKKYEEEAKKRGVKV
uniref:Chemosensory protein 18 n=1 Tax=Agrilus planipennis TaxID=224129 RepID=A0A890UJG8_AGRPL|nr:chemosensory protein 18 [Agrilus planipennis]